MVGPWRRTTRCTEVPRRAVPYPGVREELTSKATEKHDLISSGVKNHIRRISSRGTGWNRWGTGWRRLFNPIHAIPNPCVPKHLLLAAIQASEQNHFATRTVICHRMEEAG